MASHHALVFFLAMAGGFGAVPTASYVLADDPPPVGCSGCSAGTDVNHQGGVIQVTNFANENNGTCAPDTSQNPPNPCKGHPPCKWWGTYKVKNTHSSDIYWEDWSLSRVKIKPGETFEKIVPQSEAKECPCPYDSGGGWHNCEFKAFDAATGGNQLASYIWHCTKCRQ